MKKNDKTEKGIFNLLFITNNNAHKKQHDCFLILCSLNLKLYTLKHIFTEKKLLLKINRQEFIQKLKEEQYGTQRISSLNQYEFINIQSNLIS